MAALTAWPEPAFLYKILLYSSIHIAWGATYLPPLLQSAAGGQPTYLTHRLIRAVAYPPLKQNVSLGDAVPVWLLTTRWMRQTASCLTPSQRACWRRKRLREDTET